VKRKGVNAPRELAREYAIDCAVAGEPRLAEERLGHYDHFEMRFRSRWNAMLVALVDHLQVLGYECVPKLPLNFLLDRHGATIPTLAAARIT
jgi:hypothetical protein